MPEQDKVRGIVSDAIAIKVPLNYNTADDP